MTQTIGRYDPMPTGPSPTKDGDWKCPCGRWNYPQDVVCPACREHRRPW